MARGRFLTEATHHAQTTQSKPKHLQPHVKLRDELFKQEGLVVSSLKRVS